MWACMKLNIFLRSRKAEELGESPQYSSLSTPPGFERIQQVGCWEAQGFVPKTQFGPCGVKTCFKGSLMIDEDCVVKEDELIEAMATKSKAKRMRRKGGRKK